MTDVTIKCNLFRATLYL